MNSRSSNPLEAEVVVVGAGPTGLVSALLLAGAGHRVVVVEQWPQPYPLPRAVGISHESLWTLQDAGVLADALPDMLFTTDGSRVTEIHAADGEVLARRTDSAQSLSGYPERASFCQPVLEQTLSQRAAAHPLIDLRRGWRVTSVTSTADGQRMRVAAVPHAGSPAEPQASDSPDTLGVDTLEVEARYVLGCDGANSIVARDWVDVEDLGFAYDWLVVDVIPSTPREFHPNLGQILGPPRPTTLVSGGPGRRRWEFMRLEGETKEELARPETAWRLLAPYDVTPQNAILERSAEYTFGGRWARQWRSGRKVLAGDAAHLMPPFLGEGFNSGIRDARAVSWRLDLILRGLADESLLDDYSSERIAHVREIVRQAVELGRIFCILDPQEAAARDERLRTLRDRPEEVDDDPVTRPAWRLGSGTWIDGDPNAGFLGIQGRVAGPDGERLLGDVLGTGGFTLLGLDADPLDSLTDSQRSWWQSIGGLDARIGEGGLADVDGRYRHWFDEHDCDIALLRPDHYVFGTAGRRGAPGLLTALASALQHGHSSVGTTPTSEVSASEDTAPEARTTDGQDERVRNAHA